MNGEIVSVLFQAGMVGAFIFFALEINKRHSQERADRDIQWRDFLKEERTSRENGTKSMIESLKAHDENSQTRAEAILEEARNSK